MNKFFLLLRYEFLAELRSRERIFLLLSFAVLISAMVGSAAGLSFLDPAERQNLFPFLLWFSSFLSMTFFAIRQGQIPGAQGITSGLKILRVSPIVIFLARMILNFLLFLVVQFALILFIAVFLNISLYEHLIILVDISLLTVGACASLITLLAPVSRYSKVQQLLRPLIVLPLLFPVFLAAVSVTLDILVGENNLSGNFSLKLLFFLNFLYLFLGCLLYEYTLSEE